MELSG